MLRILWILSLASLTIGARKPPWNKSFEKTLVEWALSDEPSILNGYSATSSDSESPSTNPCEYASNCHPDSSTSTASPVAEPETLDDSDLDYGLDDDWPFDRIHEDGSKIGTPGVDFPDFTDFPETSFSCSDQEWVPGYYADLESRCQVFHACWPDRRESFLCPVGKIFNQALRACDHWYNSNCSLAPHYYSVNGDPQSIPTKGAGQDQLNTIILTDPGKIPFILQFLPVKAKVKIFPKTSADSKSKTFAKRTKRHIYTTEPQDFAQEPQSTTEASVTEAEQSTQSPECPETIKYINVEAAVELIFDRLDNFVKNIIRGGKEYMAANDAEKSCSTAHTDKIPVSAKIKPLVPPMGEEEEPAITSKTDAAVDPTATKPPVAGSSKKPVDSRVKRSRLTISPLTKTALIDRYIDLLIKLKKADIDL